MDKINRLDKAKALPAIGALSAAVSAALWFWILINQYYFQFFVLTHPFPIQVCQRNYLVDSVRILVITGGIDNP